MGFPDGSAGKELAYNVGDLGSIPGLRRSSGEGNSYPFQCSGLKSSMDCIVHGVAKMQVQFFRYIMDKICAWQGIKFTLNLPHCSCILFFNRDVCV